jgi:hypothetical protein
VGGALRRASVEAGFSGARLPGSFGFPFFPATQAGSATRAKPAHLKSEQFDCHRCRRESPGTSPGERSSDADRTYGIRFSCC